MAGNVTDLPLPDNKPIRALLPSLVTLLDLTEKDQQGQELDYRLYSRRLQQILAPDDTLTANGIMPDDQLRIVPMSPVESREFEMITEPSSGTRLPLYPNARIAIGRGPDNDIIIRHAAVSRQHGELVWQDGVHIYRDLNSANGSYINNQPVSEPMPISLGSILSLGESVRLRYQTMDEVQPRTAASPAPVAEGLNELESPTHTRLTPLPRGSVFISYNQSQKHFVEKLVKQLRQSNFHIYWDQEIPPGANPADAMNKALSLADIMLVVLSPAAATQPALASQWNEFILARKPIVTVMAEASEIPKPLQSFPLLRYQGDIDSLSREITGTLLAAI